MADINVNVVLPDPISVDVTSPTQALATNVSIPGPQGPTGPQGPSGAQGPIGPTGIINTGELDLRYYSINNPSGFITGVDLSNYATLNNLASTGNTLDNKINSLSGYVNFQDSSISNNLISTGATLVSNINAVASNLYITGNTLNSNITSLSGTLVDNYATIVNLTSTGSNLNIKIDTTSGYLQNQLNNLDLNYATDTQLATTGFILDNKINTLSGYGNNTFATITNLILTGGTLDNKINSLSGYVNVQDNTISTNLNATGNTLNNKINSLSGVSVLTYGNQAIFGNKIFNDDTYINNLFVTGTQTIVSTNNFSVQSPYLLLNLTGGAVDGGIFFVTGSGLTGLNDTGPIIGFDHSKNFKFGISTRNSDLSTLPDIASVQDIQAYSGVALNTFATITNLASTGSTLDSKINTLSGYGNNTFATITNLASTGSTLDSKINTLSGYGNNTFATITNLGSTGTSLTNSINSLSGTLTSNYVTKINGQFDNRPTVNGTGILLSGEAAALPDSIVYTSGNQLVSGFKTFNTGILFTLPPSGTGIFGIGPYINITGALASGNLFTGINISVVDDSRNTSSRMLNLRAGVSGLTDRFFVPVSGTSIMNSAFNINGNLTVSGNTTVTGHISAASKSFLIPHPVDSSKKLQYGSLESPYHGIRLTDKNKISADLVKVNLPDYISALVNDEKINIQLTNINHNKILFVKDVNINENNFIVGMNRSWFDKNEYEFYWSFTAERKDIPKLTVEF